MFGFGRRRRSGPGPPDSPRRVHGATGPHGPGPRSGGPSAGWPRRSPWTAHASTWAVTGCTRPFAATCSTISAGCSAPSCSCGRATGRIRLDGRWVAFLRPADRRGNCGQWLRSSGAPTSPRRRCAGGMLMPRTSHRARDGITGHRRGVLRALRRQAVGRPGQRPLGRAVPPTRRGARRGAGPRRGAAPR